MRHLMTVSTAMILATAPAFAQDVVAPATDPALQPQIAEQCMTDLTAFNQEATGSLQQSGAVIADAPRADIQRLTDAARVFAMNGNEDACQMVLAEIRNTFSVQSESFLAANPDVAAYRMTREEEIATAVPVAEAGRLLRADDVIGADLRSPLDEDLGDIDDVILNAADGTIAYILLTRGGFLGMGEDYVPVRWSDLRVTPDGETFVINMTEEQFDNAPTIDTDMLDTGPEWRAGVDDWWTQNVQG